VLVDPVPLAAGALSAIGSTRAVCLTAGSHQRSAWRLRRELGVEVWAPALARELEEEPDRRYGDGDDLPGGLRAVFTPGAGTTQHTLLASGPPRCAFVSDLLLRPPDGPLALIPADYAADPAQARESVERLLELDFDVLLLAHGRPVVEDPKDAIRAALAAG
jgi:glyoxylase-like metal-dependent hydrolase (beta-lactamase superfamily II)